MQFGSRSNGWAHPTRVADKSQARPARSVACLSALVIVALLPKVGHLIDLHQL
jgi:hypothetical protein